MAVDGRRGISRRAALTVAATCAGYAAVVAWLTWPLAARLATHLPHTTFICDFDLRQMIWALAWQSHALATAPSRLFEANLYHPTPHALLYADAGFGALPYFLPTFLATGNPVLASNLMFLGSVALTATLLHLVVARWTGLASAGIVAAATLLATRWTLWTWVPAAPNYAVMQALPVVIYLAAATTPGRARTALLAALVVLHGLVTPYYAAATLVPLGVLAAARLARPAARAAGGRLLLAVGAAAAVLAVAYAPYGWIRTLEPDLRYQTWWGFVRGHVVNLPWSLLVGPTRPTSVPAPLLGLVALGAVARWLPRPGRTAGERTAWRHGLLWTAAGVVLSLTPTVRVLDAEVRLPHADLVDRFPGLDLLRDPHRMGVAALFGLALLAGAAFAECVRWLERLSPMPRPRLVRGGAAVATAVLAAGVVWAPMALRVAPWPAEYPLARARHPDSPMAARLRAPGGPLLELPVEPAAPFATQLALHGHALFDSIGHWRPLVNGYGGFFPAAFVERMRLAARLPDAAALAALRRDTGVELVRVRARPDRPLPPRWEALARRGGGEGLRLVLRDGDALLFAVEPPGEATARAAR